MTLTRWWLAGVMTVTLGATTGWAQTCGGSSCRGDLSRAARVPYYNEVADILYPVAVPAPECPRSSSVVWQGLFNAVAHCQTEPTDGCGRDAAAHRTAMLLKMAHFYTRTGHYLTAQFYARLACKLDPNCPEAQLILAQAMRANAPNMMDDHEACEEPARGSAKDKDYGCDPLGGCVKAVDPCKQGCESAAKQCTCPVAVVPAPAVIPASVRKSGVRLMGGDRGISIVSKNFEATCDSLKYVPNDHDSVLLRGNACVHFKMQNRPARISADSILLNLTDGSFEINPKTGDSDGSGSILGEPKTR